MEELENKLCLEHGRVAVMVRNGPGTQSESISGTLIVYTESFPIKFAVATLGRNLLFTVNDIKTFEEKDDTFIITMKNQEDYSIQLGGACPCGEDH